MNSENKDQLWIMYDCMQSLVIIYLFAGQIGHFAPPPLARGETLHCGLCKKTFNTVITRFFVTLIIVAYLACFIGFKR